MRKPASAGAVSTATLATVTSPIAVPTGSRVAVEVQQGHGALVRAATAGSSTTTGTVFLVDARGTRYAIGRNGQYLNDLAALGYRGLSIPAVPQAWTKLFGDGPALNQFAASQPADR